MLEKKLKESEHKLKERIKELNCLYSISQLTEKPDISVDEILRGLLDLIPPAWQFPEITCVKIEYGEKTLQSENFKESEWSLMANVLVNEKSLIITVLYLEEKPFLEEEKLLIKDIGNRLKAILVQKEAEKKIQSSERWLKTTLNSIGDAVIATDINGDVLFLNPIAESLTGWESKEAIGKPLSDIFNIVNEYTRKKVENPVSRVIKEGGIIGLANHTILISKSGKEIPIDDSGAPIKDDKGKIKGVVLVFRNIKERKKAEKKILKSEEKYRLLFENTIEGIAIHDIVYDAENIPINYIIRDINPQFEKLLSIKKEDVINKKATEAYQTDEVPYLDIYSNVAETMEPIFFETYFPPMDKHFSISVFSPKKRSFVTVFEDITNRKATEMELIESEEKYREAYNLVNFYKDLFTHDMNNILQNIISSVDFYSMFRNDPEKLKELGDITEFVKIHAKRAADLVSNVRKLSKLETDETELSPVEVFNVLRNSVDHTISGFQDRNVKIEVKGLSKEIKVLGNELLIDVFDNILNNAVKYNNNEKEINVEVELSKIEEDNTQYIKFEFKDYGIGVPDEKKDYLFERQYTEDTSKRGMGMGLSLVKKIVNKYGCKIWVEDRIEGDYAKGSNFIVLLKEA